MSVFSELLDMVNATVSFLKRFKVISITTERSILKQQFILYTFKGWFHSTQVFWPINILINMQTDPSSVINTRLLLLKGHCSNTVIFISYNISKIIIITFDKISRNWSITHNIISMFSWHVNEPVIWPQCLESSEASTMTCYVD